MSVKKTSQILKLKLKKSKLAIIDIGSNSVRLVIYPDSGKYPYPCLLYTSDAADD